jgi:hypothetical protein
MKDLKKRKIETESKKKLLQNETALSIFKKLLFYFPASFLASFTIFSFAVIANSTRRF